MRPCSIPKALCYTAVEFVRHCEHCSRSADRRENLESMHGGLQFLPQVLQTTLQYGPQRRTWCHAISHLHITWHMPCLQVMLSTQQLRNNQHMGSVCSQISESVKTRWLSWM